MSNLFLEIITKYFNVTPQTLNYKDICDDVFKLSNARVAVINLLTDDNKYTQTVAISGYEDIRHIAENLFGFELIGKKWEVDDFAIKAMDTPKLINQGDIINSTPHIQGKVANAIKASFGVGDILSIGLFSHNKVVGTIVFVMKRGETLINTEQVEIFAKQISGILYRKKIEEDIAQALNKTKIISEYSPDVLTLVDKNKVITYINKVYPGFEIDKVVGDHVLNYISDNELKKQYSNWLDEVFNKGISITKEVKTLGNKKTIRDYLINIVPIKIGEIVDSAYIISSDITEQKLTENLAKSQYELNAILQTMIEGIVKVNLQGQIEYANPAAKEILNIEKDELTGKYFQSREWNQIDEHGNPYPSGKLPLAIVLSEKRSVTNVEHPIISEDGTWKWLSVNAAPLYDTNNNMYGAVANFRDITWKKNAENELKKSLQENELILKEVHHRINNNMLVIKSLLGLQLNKYKNKQEIKSILQDAISRVQSMALLYNKLYRSENNNKVEATTFIPALIHEIISIFPNTSQIKINTDIDNIELDAKIISPLCIIINELVTNTIKYAFKDFNFAEINVNLKVDKKHITIQYSDNGIGLPVDDDTKKTNGFGMELIQLLTQQLSGSVKHFSNNGAVFIIKFNI